MKVGIIGAGTMGGGIAQVFAQSGHEVLLCDINDELAQKGKARIVKSLDKLVAKGKMEQPEAEAVAQRLTTGTKAVSYTHLDVYKRQALKSLSSGRSLTLR